jgi:hypothetical protein
VNHGTIHYNPSSASFLSDAVSLAWQAITLLLALLSGIILGLVS